MTTTTVLRPLIRDNPGRPVPEETFTHSHPSGSSCFLYHLSPFATVHGILFIQLTCLTVLTQHGLVYNYRRRGHGYGSHICRNNILTMTVLFVKGTSSTSTPTKPTRPAVTSTKTVTGQLPSVSEPVQPTVVPTELVRPWDCHPPVAGLTQNYLSYDTLNTSCPSHSLVRPTLCWSYWTATSHKSLELI